VRAFLDRGDKKNVAAIGHNQHDLSRISPLVRVDQDVLEPVFLDREDDLLEGNAASGLQAIVLVRVPPEWLHAGILAQCVPFVIRLPAWLIALDATRVLHAGCSSIIVLAWRLGVPGGSVLELIPALFLSAARRFNYCSYSGLSSVRLTFEQIQLTR